MLKIKKRQPCALFEVSYSKKIKPAYPHEITYRKSPPRRGVRRISLQQVNKAGRPVAEIMKAKCHVMRNPDVCESARSSSWAHRIRQSASRCHAYRRGDAACIDKEAVACPRQSESEEKKPRIAAKASAGGEASYHRPVCRPRAASLLRVDTICAR